jgi:glutamate transport system substrate-binding protein
MRLSHIARIAAVAAAMVFTATACGEQANLGSSAPAPSVAQGVSFPAGTTMARLNEAGTLRVGTKFDQPLFGLRGLDGNPVGFDVEIAKIIAGKLGIPADGVTYTETPSRIREDTIANNQVDVVVATYTINAARKERVSFAGPYYVAGQDLMVAADNTTITGPDSLRAANARVCSVSGSTPAKNIEQYVDPANIVLFDVYSKCADALRNGQVEALTTDNVILLGLVDSSQGAFKLVGQQFTKEPYGVGIAKGDVAFCEFINQTLQEAAADGSYQAAWAATAGKVQPEAPTLPPADACS